MSWDDCSQAGLSLPEQLTPSSISLRPKRLGPCENRQAAELFRRAEYTPESAYTARRDSAQSQDSPSAVSWPEQQDLGRHGLGESRLAVYVIPVNGRREIILRRRLRQVPVQFVDRGLLIWEQSPRQTPRSTRLFVVGVGRARFEHSLTRSLASLALRVPCVQIVPAGSFTASRRSAVHCTGRARFEHATDGLRVRRSARLSYRPRWFLLVRVR